MNLLSAENGGQLLVAPNDLWFRTIDGKEDYIYHFEADQDAVFAFKDEKPATFDTFTVLIPGTLDENVKEFELLVADDSPTGTFRSMGKFQTQNVKIIKTPYQEFKFPEVTAKYLKVKLISAHGGGRIQLSEFRLLGQLGETVTPVASSPTPPAEPKATNLLSAENGGQLLVAPNDLWFRTIDGKEDYIYHFEADQDAVFAFKDEKPATFDTFAVLIPGTLDENVKEFELLVADDSPTGTFRSMGKFQTQNVKLIKTPYQEFKFPEVTAKYLKVKLISAHGGGRIQLSEFRLLGQLGETVTPVASSPTPPAEPKAMNLLSAENGGQLLVAPNDLWFRTIDGKEDYIYHFEHDQDAVFAFKEEKPATFDTFTVLIPGNLNS